MATSTSPKMTTAAMLDICRMSSANLPPATGLARRSALVDTNKLSALCTNLPDLEHGNAWYWINTNSFIEVLEKFSDYNGVRVYIACYPEFHRAMPAERAKQLVLIFVPTRTEGTKVRKDDTTNIWTVDENLKPVHLSEGTARAWIMNYRDLVLPHLNAEGENETKEKPFQETLSIWYDRTTIFGDGTAAGDPGLINFIKCAKDPTKLDNYVTAVKVHFCAFLEGEGPLLRRHRLTVIFQLHQKEDGPFDKKFVPGSKLFLGSKSIPTDTGVPCPPSGHCEGSFIDD